MARKTTEATANAPPTRTAHQEPKANSPFRSVGGNKPISRKPFHGSCGATLLRDDAATGTKGLGAAGTAVATGEATAAATACAGRGGGVTAAPADGWDWIALAEIKRATLASKLETLTQSAMTRMGKAMTNTKATRARTSIRTSVSHPAPLSTLSFNFSDTRASIATLNRPLVEELVLHAPPVRACLIQLAPGHRLFRCQSNSQRPKGTHDRGHKALGPVLDPTLADDDD